MDNFRSGAQYPFILSLDAGSSVKLAIKRLDTGLYLDFSDNAFKSNGHTTKWAALTRDGSALNYVWNTSGLVATPVPIRVEWDIDGDISYDNATLNDAPATTQPPTANEIKTAVETSELLAKEATVNTRMPQSAYMPPDNEGIATLRAQFTAQRAALLDNLSRLDVTLSSRMAASTWVPPDNQGISALLSNLSTDRAALLDNLSRLDTAVSSRLGASSYVAPANATVGAILTALTDAAFGLSALRNVMLGVADGVSSAASGLAEAIENVPGNVRTAILDDLNAAGGGSAPSAEDNAAAVYQAIHELLLAAAAAGGYIEELTERNSEGTRRFTLTALDHVVRRPEEMDLVQAQYPDLTVSIMYSFTKTFVAPSPEEQIVSVDVYTGTDLLGTEWPLLVSKPYTDGQTSVSFLAPTAGFFRLAFVDVDGNVGELGAPFAGELVYDLNLTFKLSVDSDLFIVGDSRYLTIEATEINGKATKLPPTKFTVLGPVGADGSVPETPVVDGQLGICDGMNAKYLFTPAAAGKYLVNIEVFSGYEVIQNKTKLAFKVKDR